MGNGCKPSRPVSGVESQNKQGEDNKALLLRSMASSSDQDVVDYSVIVMTTSSESESKGSVRKEWLKQKKALKQRKKYDSLGSFSSNLLVMQSRSDDNDEEQSAYDIDMVRTLSSSSDGSPPAMRPKRLDFADDPSPRKNHDEYFVAADADFDEFCLERSQSSRLKKMASELEKMSLETDWYNDLMQSQDTQNWEKGSSDNSSARSRNKQVNEDDESCDCESEIVTDSSFENRVDMLLDTDESENDVSEDMDDAKSPCIMDNIDSEESKNEVSEDMDDEKPPRIVDNIDLLIQNSANDDEDANERAKMDSMEAQESFDIFYDALQQHHVSLSPENDSTRDESQSNSLNKDDGDSPAKDKDDLDVLNCIVSSEDHTFDHVSLKSSGTN